jgi:hypothetical protein
LAATADSRSSNQTREMAIQKIKNNFIQTNPSLITNEFFTLDGIYSSIGKEFVFFFRFALAVLGTRFLSSLFS